MEGPAIEPQRRGGTAFHREPSCLSVLTVSPWFKKMLNRMVAAQECDARKV